MAIGINNGIADDPLTAMGRRLRDLERLVQQLAAGRTLENAAIGQGGLEIVNGGALKVLNQTNGTAVLDMGEVGLNSVPADGRTQQMAFLLTRDDGTPAMQLADLNETPGHTHLQAWQVLDRSANIVLADDTGAAGLARPHLASTLFNMNTGSWPTTTGTSYSNLMLGYLERQNPGISFSIYIHADASTTGQFRLTVDSTTVATSPTVTGSLGVWSGTYYWPAGWTFGSVATIGLDGIRTAGTDTISAQQRLLQGTQS